MGIKTEIGVVKDLFSKAESQIKEAKRYEDETRDISGKQIEDQIMEGYSALYLRVVQILGKQGKEPSDVYKVPLSEPPVYDKDLKSYVDGINSVLADAHKHHKLRSDEGVKLVKEAEKTLASVKETCNGVRILIGKKFDAKEKELSKSDFKRYEAKYKNYYESVKEMFAAAKELEDEAKSAQNDIESVYKKGTKYLNSIGEADMKMTVAQLEGQSKSATGEIKSFSLLHKNKRNAVHLLFDNFRKAKNDTLFAQFKSLESAAGELDKDKG